MAQTRILYNGRYICPECDNEYELKDADIDHGDGYCEFCKDEQDDYIPLRMKK